MVGEEKRNEEKKRVLLTASNRFENNVDNKNENKNNSTKSGRRNEMKCNICIMK